jgi:hypothetical protein
MKLKLYTTIGLAAITLLISCAGDDKKEFIDKSVMPTPEEKAAMEKTAAEKATVNSPMPAQTTMPATVIPGQTNVPVTLPQQPQTMTINPQMVTQTPAPTTTQPGMNPPHGQPGHRCDITVGAPLNSKPAPAQPTTVSTAPQQPQVTMKEIPNPTKTAPGMNPPHGEPGHRCDIAVGAPLDSKPAAPAATQPAQITPPALITAPKSDSNKN